VLDGILYVMGGHDNQPATHALTNVWAYDPQTDFWTNRAPLPTGRHFLGQCAAAVDGIIYLVGGTGVGMPGSLVLPVAAYNPRTDTWTNGAPMPTGRGNLAACAVDGIIYAIGGALDTTSQTAAVEAYDPKSNHWTSKRSMPQARWFVTASVVNGLIYVFHGTDVFAYDPKTDSWTTKTNHFSPFSWGLMSTEVEGTIYLFGGFTQDWSDGNDFALAYDPILDQFSALRKMPRKRATAACGVIGGKIYLAAGASKEPLVNPDAVFYKILDVFDPHRVTPQIHSGTLENSNSFRLVWQAETGMRYGIVSSPDVTGTWTRMPLPTGTTVTATNGLVETTCSVPSGEARRFFRVLEAN
jgi:N-acetylneuraminic acid mutarotase